MAAGGIPKPSLNDFALLHRLGEARLEVAGDGVLATRDAEGLLQVALWNYAAPGSTAAARHVELAVIHGRVHSARVTIVDPEHGDAGAAFRRMGSPRYPTQMQIAELRRAGALPPSVELPMVGGRAELTIPAHGLALLTIR